MMLQALPETLPCVPCKGVEPDPRAAETPLFQFFGLPARKG